MVKKVKQAERRAAADRSRHKRYGVIQYSTRSGIFPHNAQCIFIIPISLAEKNEMYSFPSELLGENTLNDRWHPMDISTITKSYNEKYF